MSEYKKAILRVEQFVRAVTEHGELGLSEAEAIAWLGKAVSAQAELLKTLRNELDDLQVEWEER